MTQLLAYPHGDKAMYLARVRAHREADELVRGLLGDGVLVVDCESGTARSLRNPGRILGCKNPKGYLVCTLHRNGIRVQAKLHRIVWIAAGNEIPDGLVIDHINRNKADNRIANLRLVTQAENSRNRRSYSGEGNPAARITKDVAQDIRNAHPEQSYSQIAVRFGVSKSLVAAIVRKELWS